MKRLKFLLIPLLLSVVLLCGCAKEDKACKTLNNLFSQAAKYTVKVKTTADGVTLNGVYVYERFENGYTVDYSVERLSKIDLNDLSKGFKTTVNGTATVRNGEIVFNTGNLTEIPCGLAFNFSKKYLSEIKTDDTGMKAKVSDVKGFTGGEAESAKDMTVAVDYTRDKLIKIELNYSTDVSDIVVVVEFD